MAVWDRRAGEPAKAYDAFTHYYRLPTRERSIDAAYLVSNQDQTRIGKRGSGQWRAWAAKFEWVARAAAYDEHLAEQDRLLWEERRRQLKERDWEQAEEVRAIVTDALPYARGFIQRHTTVIRRAGQTHTTITETFDLASLARVMEIASKVQRLASNEPTENIQLTGAALDAYIAAQMARLVNGGETGAGNASEPNEAEADDETDGDDEPM